MPTNECSGRPHGWFDVLERHRHAALTAQDVRKLVHQAVRGPGHAVTSADAALARLEAEVRTMGDGPAAPLVEAIAPRATMVRVHLRPWVARGGSLHALAAAFAASAADVDPEAPLDAALDVVDTALAALSPALHDEWRRELPAWRAAGCPAVHHSAAYAAAVRPAYRVVTGSRAAALVAALASSP